MKILRSVFELPETDWADSWSRCRTEEPVTSSIPDSGQPYAWTSAATIEAITEAAGDLLMFHAAGVSDSDGRVVALVAPSGTGKSTASIALCADHYGYVTDETVAATADGTVLPFPKPIALHHSSPDGGGAKQHLSPDALELRPAPAALRLTGLIALKRRTEPGPPEVELLPTAYGVGAVIEHMSAVSLLTDPLAQLVTAIQACGGVHEVTYTDAADLVGPVEQAMAAEPQHLEWVHHPGAEAPAAPADGRARRWWRAAYTDAVETDGTLLLLQRQEFRALAGIAATLWLAAATPRSEDELVTALVDAHGPHPEAAELTRSVLEELEVARVLEAL